MKTQLAAAMAAAAAMAFAPQAHAGNIAFEFNGLGYTGSGVFTTAPNVEPADPNPNCGMPGENACRHDPAGAWMITGISGTFSDTTSGISNAGITGLVAIKPANERDPTFDPMVPVSLSFIDFGTGAGAGALSYDNLYYPDGSPKVCSGWDPTGTFLDVYGVAFAVEGGYTVAVWGNGDVPGLGLTYGVGVTDGNTQLSYAFQGVNAVAAPVPEPSTFALLGGGLIGMLVWRKRSPRAANAST